MEAKDAEIIATAYQKFNARDIDGALALLRPDVEWANGMEGGSVVGTDAVRNYWTRQWQTVSPEVTPVSISGKDGRYTVEAHQIVRSPSGDMISESAVVHVFVVKRGKIAAMKIASAGD